MNEPPRGLRFITVFLGLFGMFKFAGFMIEGVMLIGDTSRTVGGVGAWPLIAVLVAFMLIPIGLLMSAIGLWYMWRWGWFVPVACLTFLAAIRAGQLAHATLTLGLDQVDGFTLFILVFDLAVAIAILVYLRKPATRAIFGVHPAGRSAA